MLKCGYCNRGKEENLMINHVEKRYLFLVYLIVVISVLIPINDVQAKSKYLNVPTVPDSPP